MKDKIVAKHFSMWFTKQDMMNIEIIKQKYGMSTDTEAVRLALHTLANFYDLVTIPKHITKIENVS